MAWHCLQPANSQLGSYLPCLALKKRKASWEKQGRSGPWLRESSSYLALSMVRPREVPWVWKPAGTVHGGLLRIVDVGYVANHCIRHRVLSHDPCKVKDSSGLCWPASHSCLRGSLWSLSPWDWGQT